MYTLSYSSSSRIQFAPTCRCDALPLSAALRCRIGLPARSGRLNGSQVRRTWQPQMSIVFSRSTSFLVEPGSLASMSSMTAVICCRFAGLKNSLKVR